MFVCMQKNTKILLKQIFFCMCVTKNEHFLKKVCWAPCESQNISTFCVFQEKKVLSHAKKSEDNITDIQYFWQVIKLKNAISITASSLASSSFRTERCRREVSC